MALNKDVGADVLALVAVSVGLAVILGAKVGVSDGAGLTVGIADNIIVGDKEFGKGEFDISTEGTFCPQPMITILITKKFTATRRFFIVLNLYHSFD